LTDVRAKWKQKKTMQIRSKYKLASHLTDMRAKWKQKKTMQIRSKYKLVKASVNSWTSFFEVRENNGRQKAQYLPFMIEVGIVIRNGKL
jgi:hypothetical protein